MVQTSGAGHKINTDDEIHRITTTGKDDRSYVRTIATSYDSGDWTYTITFDTSRIRSQQEIVFVGVGSGAAVFCGSPCSPFHEPASSATFRIHQGGFGGRVDIVVIDAIGNHVAGTFATIGDIPNRGLYKARVEKDGGTLTFSILDGITEDVILDFGVPVSGTMTIPTFLDDTNSRLFFGSAQPITKYDDMVVEFTPPAPTLPTTKADCKKGGWESYGVFKNQGDCVSFIATKGKNPPAN